MGRMSILLGDFNLPGDTSHANYEFPLPGDVAPVGRQHRRDWQWTWAGYTEVTDEGPSHFTAATNIAARLDRTFVSAPGWAAYGLVLRFEVQENPKGTHMAKVTDHSPVLLCMQARGMLAAGARPIARATIRDCRFSKVLGRTLELWGFDRWEVADQVEFYPLAVRSTARTIRDWQRGAEAGSQSASIVAAARAVAMQRPRGAVLLIEHRPKLRSPQAFAEEV